MTFLELCRELVSEFGIGGGTGPDKVTNQTGELANVVRWVRDASLDLDNRWEDWRYLWLEYFGTIPVDVSFPTPPKQPGVLARRWDTQSLRYRTLSPLGSTWSPIGYVDFPIFRARFDPDVAQPGTPQAFTVMPDNTLQFDRPADQDYQLKGAFWRMPPVLKQDNDVPAIPEQYQRIIRVRAVKYYADKEDAPELVRLAVTEYPDLLEKLESAFLDAFRWRRAAGQSQDRAGAANMHEPRWG